MTTKTPEELIGELTLEERVSLLSGQDFWSVSPIERLGIGTLRVTDGPNGARGGGTLIGGVTAACYPCGIALGATWDPDLTQEIGADLAREVKSKQAHVSLAPTCNIHRSVTNGRNFECYSEDPELTAALAVGYIIDLQKNNIGATIKHFIGNESEINRTTVSSEIDERVLREVYLRPFEDAVKKAGTWGIMSAYNRLNGTYAAENHWALTEVLRGDWGYDGIVMSDWFGSRSTAPTINAGLDLEMPGPTRDRGAKLVAAVDAGEVAAETVRTSALRMLRLMQRVGSLDDRRGFEERAEDLPETRALIRRAGAAATVLLKNDGVLPLEAPGKIAMIGPNARVAQIMGGGSAQLNPHYRVSPWDGLVDRLGEAALSFAQGCTNHRWEPVIEGRFTVEFFAGEALEGTPVAQEVLEDGSQAMWFDAPAGGKVDQLHFSARVTGSFTPEAAGTHRFGLHVAGFARLYVDGQLVVDAWDGWSKGRTFFEEGNDEITGEVELEAGRIVELTLELRTKPTDNLHFTAFRFGVSRPLGDAGIAEAARVASEAEVALVFVGRSGEWDTEGSDLQGIALPGRQDDLVAAVAAAQPNTVVVLQTGGPVEMPWLGEVPAVLQAWYPGQEVGHAVADVLFGAAEPGGRLPQTFPARWADNPTWSQDAEIYPGLDGKVRYEEGVFVGYRHYQQHGITPLFPFGHGLSYTSFELGEMRAEAAGAGGATARVTVTNTGARAGSTVVQLYVGDPEASVARPIRELKAFRKVRLAPGETREMVFDLAARDFAFFDAGARLWRVEPGRFVLEAGFSAEDIRARAELELAAAGLAP